MGSFNVACGVTGMNIQWNDPIYVFRVAAQPHQPALGEAVHYVDDLWQPTSFAQLTQYYDYGDYAEFEISKHNAIVDRYLQEDLMAEERPFFMGVHETVYQRMSSGPLSEPSPYGGFYEFTKKGPAYFMEKFNEVKESLTVDIDGDDDDEDDRRTAMMQVRLFSGPLRELMSHRSSIMMDAIRMELTMDNLDEILNEELAVELTKFKYFTYNLQCLNKHFAPSNYASQEDNYEEYGAMAEMISEIVNSKRELRAAEDGE